MYRFRTLIALLAVVLLATACPGRADPSTDYDGDGIPDVDDPDIDNDGVLNDKDYDSYNPDVFDPPAEPESDETDAVEPDDPESDAVEPAETADDPAGDGETETETVTGPVELALGDAYGDDARLETTVLAEFGPDGHLVTTLDENLRDASWAGATLFLSSGGTDFELQCGVNSGSGVCNNFSVPDFNCASSSSFPDPGSGPINIVWPVRQGDDGMVIDLAPTDGCVDPTGATVTGGFVYEISPDGVGSSAVFADGFESGDVQQWRAEP